MNFNLAPINNKYKTMLCRHFNNGNCSLGDKCHFAHGQQELRNSSDVIPSHSSQASQSFYRIPQHPQYFDNAYSNGPVIPGFGY